ATVNSQWQSASDEHWVRALAREAVIRPLTDQPELWAVYDLSTVRHYGFQTKLPGPHPRHAFHRVASRAGPSSQSGILRNSEKARSAGLFCPTISRLLTRMGSRGTGDSRSP